MPRRTNMPKRVIVQKTIHSPKNTQKKPSKTLILNGLSNFCPFVSGSQRKRRDSNPRYSFPYVSLANWWFQPLTHTSFF